MLRHPLVGPLLLLLIGIVLAFAIFHTIEHGVEGELFTCGILAAALLRLVLTVRELPRRHERARRDGRAPPPAPNRLGLPIVLRGPMFAVPLRR